MGRGRNAIYLAEQGYQVYGVEIRKASVETCMETARQRRLAIQAEVANLEGDYSIERDGYDLIVCFNYLQRSLFQEIKKGLRPGGAVVYETFTVEQPRFGRPTNEEFLLRHNELLDSFRDFRVIRYREGIVNDKKAVASLIAVKIP